MKKKKLFSTQFSAYVYKYMWTLAQNVDEKFSSLLSFSFFSEYLEFILGPNVLK